MRRRWSCEGGEGVCVCGEGVCGCLLSAVWSDMRGVTSANKFIGVKDTHVRYMLPCRMITIVTIV